MKGSFVHYSTTARVRVRQQADCESIRTATGAYLRGGSVVSKPELMAQAVDYRIEDDEPEIDDTAADSLIYYVVYVTYCSQ